MAEGGSQGQGEASLPTALESPGGQAPVGRLPRSPVGRLLGPQPVRPAHSGDPLP